jgi:homocysteine S-methyltransferase
MLANGSEYRGRYGLSVRQLRDWHRRRAEVLAEAGADLLALETIPDTDEAEALLSLVADLDVPCWLTYTIAGGKTRAGQSLRDAFTLAAGVRQVVAAGVNCCAPCDVAAAVSLAAEVTGKPVVAYPNSGETWDSRRREWLGRPQVPFQDLAVNWAASGARVIGGCCRVRPSGIEAISRAVACRPS